MTPLDKIGIAVFRVAVGVVSAAGWVALAVLCFTLAAWGFDHVDAGHLQFGVGVVASLTGVGLGVSSLLFAAVGFAVCAQWAISGFDNATNC